MNQSLQALSSETDLFIHKWTDFFNRLEVLASDKEFDEALNQADSLDKKVQSIETELKKTVLQNQQLELEFKINETFILDKKYIGQINHKKTKSKTEIEIFAYF